MFIGLVPESFLSYKSIPILSERDPFLDLERLEMDRQTTRQVRFFLRLHYPLRITLETTGFRGVYPDLPGCSATMADMPALYSRLEELRRDWIADRLVSGQVVPMPNSHLAIDSPRAKVELRPRRRSFRQPDLAAAASF